MQHDDRVYVAHMLEMARRVEVKVAGVTREAYDADEDFRMLLAHLVQIIGEAASRVSPAFRDLYPGVPWKKIVGMRHRIVHDYLHIDADILWEVVTRNIPELVKLLSAV